MHCRILGLALFLALCPTAATDAAKAYRAAFTRMRTLGQAELPAPESQKADASTLVQLLDELLLARTGATTERKPGLAAHLVPTMQHYAPLLTMVDALPAGEVRFVDAASIEMRTRVPHLSHARELARILRVDAQLAAIHGDGARVRRRAGQLLRIAAAVDNDCLLISRLVADAIRAQTCRAIGSWLRHGQLDGAATLTVLRAHIGARLPLATVFAGERKAQRNTFRALDKLVGSELTDPLTPRHGKNKGAVDTRQLKRHLASEAFRRELRAAMELHARLLNDQLQTAFAAGDLASLRRFGRALDQRSAALAPRTKQRGGALVAELKQLEGKEWPAETVTRVRRFIVDVMAESVVLSLMPITARLLEKSHTTDAHLRATLVAAALAQRRKARGAYPAALSELDLPAALLADPFGQGPLRYRRHGDRYVLYSVGKDGRDDGGTELSNQPEEPDMVYAGGVR